MYFWGLNPQGHFARILFYVLLYAVLGAFPIAVQTPAAAAIMEVTGARNPWVRALVGAATAGAGAMLYAPSGIGPGLGSPFFASVTVGSGTGVLLQSARALKPSRPWWLYPGAYVLGVWLVWMVHILF